MCCPRKLVILTIVIICTKADLYSNFISDFVIYNDRNAMVTEFSCKPKGSLLETTNNYQLINIVSTDTRHIPFPCKANRRYFVLNLDCPNSRGLLNKVNDLKYFSSPIRWIVLTKENSNASESFFEHYFSKVDILVDSDINFGRIHTINETVVVEKLYKKRNNFPVEVESYGIWMKSKGFIETNFFEKTAVRRRKNLSGTTLNSCLVITQNESLNHLTDKRDKHIDSIAKVNYVLVNHLADIYNISLKFSVESSWGYKNNKSEWTGMIGELTTNKADIGGTALFFTKSRVDIIDYISMTTRTRANFVFRQPKLSYVKNVYTLPFDIKVWISIILLVLIGGLALYIVIKWEWKKKQIENNKEKGNETVGLQDSFLDVAFFTIGAVCQQGAAFLPFSLPGRISSICLFLSLMFLYTSYAANIVALMQSSSTSINTLTDLLKSRLTVGVADTVYSRFYFPAADEPVRKALYNQKVAPKGKKANFMPMEEGVKRMRQGLFAFHMESGSGYKLVSETFREDEKCGLQEISFLQVSDPWLAIQKNSSYKEMLKIGLRLIQESGIQNRENGLIYTKKPACKSSSSTFISVGLVDCYPPIAILAGGIAISVSFFLFELYLKHRMKYDNSQWSIDSVDEPDKD